MKQLLWLFIIFFFSCSSSEVENIEIMSYYEQLGRDMTPHPNLIMYSSIDKNGTVQTLQKNTLDSLVFYETKMNPKFFDSIISLTKDAEEKSFEPDLNNAKKVWYCGPTLRFRIKYKNGENLSFNYMYINAYSKNSNLKIVPSLYDHILSDSINGKHIDPYSRYSLTMKQKSFEKFTIINDKIGFEKIVEKLKKK